MLVSPVLSAWLFGENPPAVAGLAPGPDPGEGGWAKGDQTVLVVVLAMVLVERKDARRRPASWPGKSNAKSAIHRQRIIKLRNVAAFYAVSAKSQSSELPISSL
jgi:hypothetical protein